MQTTSRIALAAGAVFLAGCAATSTPTTPTTPASANLVGTSWTLVAFQPAAGEPVTIASARREQYRLAFEAEGRLAAQIDCNRGGGTWQATPADGQGGALRLGPVALTRMMCPPDPVSQRLPPDLEKIESYRIVDGRLHLALPGTAGSYTWERAAPR